MKIEDIEAKSIIVKSNLPDSDYVVNPYVGCQHSCIYCYARFMKRFTNHNEDWGKFLDVKINAADLVPENTDKYKGKTVTFSSVTDPYQPIENRYELTRRILQRLADLEPDLCIMTKSDLITRDIDILKKFKNCKAGISLSTLDNKIAKEIEPLASLPERRLKAVKALHNSGISNFIFISPILPKITDWKNLIKETTNFVNEYWFENLNIRPAYWANIKNWLKQYHPELLEKYKEIYKAGDDYWNTLEQKIKTFANMQDINCKLYFHH